MTRHVVHIISAVENSLGLEWMLAGLSKDYRVTVVLLNASETPLEKNLGKRGVTCLRIPLRGKWSFPAVFVRLVLLLRRLRPDVVHVHLLDAQRLGLPAAWLARVKKRIYTRHNSTFHHQYFPSGVAYDRFSNWLSTAIVSVSQATDYALFELEGVLKSKVARIPHGFDFVEFGPASSDRVDAVRKKWGIPLRKPVVGMVSRFIEWKGLRHALPAIQAFQRRFPETYLVLANANGPQSDEIKKLLAGFADGSVSCIPFEEDAAALYGAFDLFVHTPVDEHAEAFGQVYVEALACGVPSVFTRSGIACEFVEDEGHAMVVPYQNAASIEAALVRLWTDPELRRRLASRGAVYVKEHFDLGVMLEKMRSLYNA